MPKQSFQITCLPQYSKNICFLEQGHVILLRKSEYFVRRERWTLSPLRAGRPGTSGRLKRPYNCQVTCVLGLIRWRRPKFQDVSYAQPSSKALSAQKRRQGQPAASQMRGSALSGATAESFGCSRLAPLARDSCHPERSEGSPGPGISSSRAGPGISDIFQNRYPQKRHCTRYYRTPVGLCS